MRRVSGPSARAARRRRLRGIGLSPCLYERRVEIGHSRRSFFAGSQKPRPRRGLRRRCHRRRHGASGRVRTPTRRRTSGQRRPRPGPNDTPRRDTGAWVQRRPIRDRAMPQPLTSEVVRHDSVPPRSASADYAAARWCMVPPHVRETVVTVVDHSIRRSDERRGVGLEENVGGPPAAPDNGSASRRGAAR